MYKKNKKVKNSIINLIKFMRDYGVFETVKLILRKARIKCWSSKRIEDGIYQYFEHNPFVSVIAVNYNGEKDLHGFLQSIKNQSYKNYELIIVDNNSTDGSILLINDYIKSASELNVKIIKCEKNNGFAEGNNIGEKEASGELIALINVDTIIDPEWLNELVDGLRYDTSAAAATSKILFKYKFNDIKISGVGDFFLLEADLLKCLEYKKYFIRAGKKIGDRICAQNGEIVISVPCCSNCFSLKILRDDIKKEKSEYEIYLGRVLIKHEKVLNDNDNSFSVCLDLASSSNRRWIINNAGSYNNSFTGPQDRGFGEYDFGQYDSKAYTEAFCGCSVLIRRVAIANRSLFVPEFFAYYEDSELSRYIRIDSKILYVPRSVVYHRHSATSTEGSELWKYLTERSRFIYSIDDKTEFCFAKNKLTMLQSKFIDKVDRNIYSWIELANKTLIERFANTKSIVLSKKSIGIYNEYWSTYGGGEVHALNVLERFEKYDRVYLLSGGDFDVCKIYKRFNIDVSRYTKSIGPGINPSLTKKFDTFVNSTFRSNLESQCNNSYYIVSFPHKNTTEKFRQSYVFLYNSKYTQFWAKKYWGNVKHELYLPTSSVNPEYVNCKIDFSEKSKNIVNVGRFFKGEHSKKQLELLNVFIKTIGNQYKLSFCGGLNYNRKVDVEYFTKFRSVANSCPNVSVLLNISNEDLLQVYKKSLFVISATGFNEDPYTSPESFEHFGIAVLEAACTGCIPIVNSVGGPADLVDELGIGFKYKSESDLLDIFNTINKLDADELEAMSIKVIEEARNFIRNSRKSYA